MALAGELTALCVYILQQIGVLLAVGAETLLLVYYLSSAGKPTHPAHPHARFAQYAGLVLIVVSGAAALAFTQMSVITAPAFLFKWALVIALAACVALKPEQRVGGWLAHVAAGLEGAAWYALFVVHVVAPITTWVYLLLGYATWTLLFMLAWTGCLYLLLPRRPKKIVEPVKVFIQPAPTPSPVPALSFIELEAPQHPSAAPAPHAPAHHEPVAAPKPPIVVAAPAPHAPVHPSAAPAPAAPKIEEGLPSIRVMPRTPEELSQQNRGASVQFS